MTSHAQRLAEIRERVERATEWPWGTQNCSGGGLILVRGDEKEHRSRRHIQGYVQICPASDADFIAHAREDVPWLLERVRELEDDCDDYRKEVRQYREMSTEPGHG